MLTSDNKQCTVYLWHEVKGGSHSGVKKEKKQSSFMAAILLVRGYRTRM
jgi:hypothetical protein